MWPFGPLVCTRKYLYVNKCECVCIGKDNIKLPPNDDPEGYAF